jgi:triacylglycerol lipase
LESSDEVIIAFRGTETTEDWISDALARQTKCKLSPDSGMTHLGFTDIYNSARKKILGVLKTIPPSKKLLITGHSLGGALATLCAFDVSVNTAFANPTVYTYASPRVGNPDFATVFGIQISNSVRVENEFDIVPHVPPVLYKSFITDKKYQYLHVKQRYKVAFNKGSVAANHSITNYYDSLKVLDPLYAFGLSVQNPGFCPD